MHHKKTAMNSMLFFCGENYFYLFRAATVALILSINA